MTVAIKNKAPLVISQSALRKAGFKPGQDLEVRSEEGVITIVARLTPDEIQDREEIGDPMIRAAVREGYAEFLAGNARPATALQSELDAMSAKSTVRSSPRRRA